MFHKIIPVLVDYIVKSGHVNTKILSKISKYISQILMTHYQVGN